jgi:hypothetical protein
MSKYTSLVTSLMVQLLDFIGEKMPSELCEIITGDSSAKNISSS